MHAVTANQSVKSCLRFLFFTILLGVLLTLSVSAKEVYGTYGSFSVEVRIHTKQHTKIVVTAELDASFMENLGGKTLYVFGLRTGEWNDELSEHAPLATAVAEKNTTFTIEDDGTGEKYYLAYVMATKIGEEYKALHSPVTIENPEILSEVKQTEREGGSIKGIVSSGAYLGETLELGVSHAVIPIVLDQYLSLNKSDAAYSVSFGGVMTNFDKTKIGQLDAHVSALRKAGVDVTFRFLLDGSTRTTNAPSSWLYASGANENGTLYALTAEDKDAFLLLRGIFTYFAERYADGETLDFIIGYEVNERDVWNHMGNLTDSDYAREYAKVFRIAQIALLSVNQNSRVYVPISNLWVSAKPFLESFAKEMDGAAWHVAVAPYASTPTDDSLWTDPEAEDKATTTYITTRNLGVLKDFLEQDDYLLDGKRRRVIIDDIAVHTTSDDTAAQDRQAASLAYAYYSAVHADFIDAFIYHRIADSANEGASYGLRTASGVAKTAYRIYQSIDTTQGEKETKYLATVIGEKRWQKIIDGFAPREASVIARFTETGTDDADTLSSYHRTPFLSFLDGSTQGFLPYANVRVVAPKKQNTQGTDLPETVLTFEASEMPVGEAAYIARPLDGVALGKVDALAITVTVKGGGRVSATAGTLATNTAETATEAEQSTPSKSTTAATVILRMTGEKNGKKIVYEARANVAVGDRTTLVFPTSDFTRATQNGTMLWLGVADAGTAQGTVREKQAPYTVTLDSIEFLESKTGWIAVAFGFLFGILLVLAVIFGLLVLRKRIRMEQKRREMAKRRAAAARAQAARSRAQRAPQMGQGATPHTQMPQIGQPRQQTQAHRQVPQSRVLQNGTAQIPRSVPQSSRGQAGNAVTKNSVAETHAPRRRSASRTPEMHTNTKNTSYRDDCGAE